MPNESPNGSRSGDNNCAPSPEVLEERELLSGLLDGLSGLDMGAPVEEAAAPPDPGAEEPPAVVVPPAELSVSSIAAQAPASVPALPGADLIAEASSASPAAPSVSVPVAAVSSIGMPAGVEAGSATSPGTPVAPAVAPTAEASRAPVLTTETPAVVEHSTAPHAEAVDSLLVNVAVENEPHAEAPAAVVTGPAARHVVDTKAAGSQAAAEGQAPVRADVAVAGEAGPAPALKAHAVDGPTAGPVSTHSDGMAESWVDGGVSTGREFEFSPTEEEAAQPHMMEDLSAGERQAETDVQEMPAPEDNQAELAEGPIERSLVQSGGAHAASAPSWVGAEHETTRGPQAGEVRIVEHAEPGEELVSRVSQLFDLVPGWPGVDHDALEDAARSLVEDDARSGADLVNVVSTHDVSGWLTATAGTAVGFGIARRELGLQTRDTVDGSTDEEVELGWSLT